MSRSNVNTAPQTVPNFTREEMQRIFRPWLDSSKNVELRTLHSLIVKELSDRGVKEIAVR